MKPSLLLFLLIGNITFAQQFDEDRKLGHKVPGYIILQNGDTIKGQVMVQTRSKNEIKVKFYHLNEKKKKIYRPKHLLGYGYQTIADCSPSPAPIYHWRHFKARKADIRPLPFASKHVFMEVKVSGKVNLYSYYIQTNETVEVTYKHCYYLAFEDGSRERMITQDDFSWVVPAFLEDCDKIQTIVDTQMEYANLEEIVEIYNDCGDYNGIIKCEQMQLEEIKN